MHDIKAIRHDPAKFDANLARRGMPAQGASLLALDDAWRGYETQMQTLQARRNDVSKQIGQVKGQGGDATALMAEVATIKDDMAKLEGLNSAAQDALNTALASLPNLLADEVPDGADGNDNVQVHAHGVIKQVAGHPDHVAIGEALGLFDATRAAAISGARFTFLQGDLARLERAIGQFMIDLHTREHGYLEVSPPLLVQDKALFGTGQLPKFADDLFKTTTGHWLIPTAEVSLTNLVMDSIVDDEALPLRLTALTPSFRSEAGAAGKDTRGMIRQHQFYKVELVSITTPEASGEEHERMTQCAEKVLKLLDLPFRRMALCAGDTGFGSRRTYDLEVWLPGQNCYREISSCSNCGDFQARRMMARCRPRGTKDTRFVHTLNGSGVAVGRALVAILENYYNAVDGSVTVPDVLRPYMGGVERIVARR